MPRFTKADIPYLYVITFPVSALYVPAQTRDGSYKEPSYNSSSNHG